MKHKRSPIRDHRSESALFFRRAVFSFGVIALLVTLLTVNLYGLQVSDHQDYKTRSNDNRIKVVPIAPNRGLIYDRNGVLLAENRPVYSLELIPEQVKNIPETIDALSEFIDITDSNIRNFKKEKRRSRRFQTVTLKSQLTEQEVALFSVNQHKFPGVEVEGYLKRYYPFGDALTHVLGYVAKINDRDLDRLERAELTNNYKATRDIGKLGIERYYENALHGQAGYQEVEVNSRGRIIRTLKYVPPEPGQDLVLNLDIELQLYVRELLGNNRGAAIVLDPKTSGVLAMVSTPSYDPNLFVHGISPSQYNALLNDKDRPLYNRATLGTYPPASTVKPFIAVAALQENVITTNTMRNDPGYWRLPNSTTRPYRDWKKGGHGRVDIVKSVEESVDTFFYQIAYDMGIDRLSHWMTMFGFGERTGIDIHEESRANMPTREWKMSRYRKPWYQGDTIPVGIGQGYWTATPMQIAKAASVLVNHGVVNPPHLVKAFISEKTETLNASEPYPPIVDVPEKYWLTTLEGMRRVNHGKKGTARFSFTQSSYQSAGKTGTAQVFGLGENEKYDSEELAEHLIDHALYVGFAPFEKPEVIVSLVLENAGGGSSKAAPVARQIFDHILVETPPRKEVN
ncbi:penicillin-binding protein 2 [Veronia nyctiphanis]|uniref:Peptidoglycan D,D-transpeptidase MrdA n=1 Tax=Veronia nyctiphanis TaxID=1278244 RepID=A0A4Q0YPU4_9GAMM|nr:penicillin-binding protein 2 [Veronia nyctiphanis]RXJ73090.1 penicillin-binding protein 2 [Veronia nyctiphanis]